MGSSASRVAVSPAQTYPIGSTAYQVAQPFPIARAASMLPPRSGSEPP